MKSTASILTMLGERLKQARLNQDLTQSQLAELAGVSRRSVLNAEKGKTQLETFVALLVALGLTENLEHMIPATQISPVQLAKLQGKQRQRASGKQNTPDTNPHAW
jgi:putative transcriptional regulator